MSKKIEIFENTLLKLLVRRGTDQERQNVILSQGELGFTTDTKRVYIGDGETLGGIAVGGSSFLGSATSVHETFTSAAVGDTAFDSDENVMYTYVGGSGGQTNPSNWKSIGGKYSSGDSTISIDNTNKIRVDKVAAGNFNANVAGNSIEIDGSGKIALASTANINNITVRTGTDFLTIPQKFAVEGYSTRYTLPVGGTGNNFYLETDLNGNLKWSSPSNSTSFVAGTASQIPVGSIMPFVSSGQAPFGWLLCNGQTVPGASYRELSAVIGTSYGGNNTDFKVPDFRNKLIYGVENGPATSTTFRVASGTNAPLSAAGALYIIKAKPDEVVNATITVTSPLTATLDGTSITDVKRSALRGDLVVGMPNLVTSVANIIYPIGSILLTITNTNPGTRFPGTTWEQVSQGLFLVGVGTGTDLNSKQVTMAAGTANYAFGEYEHVITEAEIPNHVHTCESAGAHNHTATTTPSYTTTNGGSFKSIFVSTSRMGQHPTTDSINGVSRGADFMDAGTSSVSRATLAASTSLIAEPAHQHVIGDFGGNESGVTQAHNNIPPCYGVYVWERKS